MAAESDADLFNFATEEIDAKRNDPVTPVQQRSEPPIPVETPVSPPMGPPTPDVGFNEYQLSLTPEAAPPAKPTSATGSTGVPKEASPAPIEDAAVGSPITGSVSVTGSKTGKDTNPVSGIKDD